MKWFKLDNRLVDNHKAQALPSDLFKFWINLLCIASTKGDGDGTLPPAAEIAWRVRLPGETVDEYLAALVRCGILDEVDGALRAHDWGEHQAPPSSTPRVQKFRAKVKETEGGDVPETTPEPPPTVPETTVKRSRNVSETPKLPVSGTHRTDQKENRPEPEQKAARTTQPAPVVMSLRRDFETFYAAYPAFRQGDKDAAWRAWEQVASAGDLPAIDTVMAGLTTYKGTEEVQRNVMLGAAKFILQKRWVAPPDLPKKQAPRSWGGDAPNMPGRPAI